MVKKNTFPQNKKMGVSVSIPKRYYLVNVISNGGLYQIKEKPNRKNFLSSKGVHICGKYDETILKWEHIESIVPISEKRMLNIGVRYLNATVEISLQLSQNQNIKFETWCNIYKKSLNIVEKENTEIGWLNNDNISPSSQNSAISAKFTLLDE